MRLYGFFRGKPLNILEDVGHILIGIVPMWGWIREHRQWPPGSTLISQGKEYAPHDRVMDSYRDFLGYAIGGTIRCVGLVATIVYLAI